MTVKLSITNREKEALGEARYLRGLLLFKGLTLADWCRSRGEHPGTVHHALTGKRRGPKARRIVAELKEELGL